MQFFACPKPWKVAASIESNLRLLSSVEEQSTMEGFETAVGDCCCRMRLLPLARAK